MISLTLASLVQPLVAAALIQWTSGVAELDRAAAAAGANCRVKGIVTLVEPNGFVLESLREKAPRGVFVSTVGCGGKSASATSVGDAVVVQGRTAWKGENYVVAGQVMLDRAKEALPEPTPVKTWDIFDGRCPNRRVRLTGRVVALESGGRIFTVHVDGRHCVPVEIAGTGASPLQADEASQRTGGGGALAPALEVGQEVAVSGVVRNVYDAEGHFLAAHVGARPEDVIVDLAALALRQALWIIGFVLGAALVVAVVVLLVLWLRALREKREMALLAAERTRLADELHDTVEQYLAGARIFLSGAVRTPELPDRATKAIRAATDVLDEAKVNVGKAIDALRTRGGAQ